MIIEPRRKKEQSWFRLCLSHIRRELFLLFSFKSTNLEEGVSVKISKTGGDSKQQQQDLFFQSGYNIT